MPPAVAAAAAAIATAVADAAFAATSSALVATAAMTIAYYAAEVGISLAVTVGLDALFTPRMPSAEAAMTTFRQARPPKQRGWGQYRVSGPAALYQAYQNTLFQVVAINDGRIQSFDSWFLHDDQIEFANAQGFQGGEVKQMPSGRYPTNHVGIFWRFGLIPETNYPGPTGVIPAQWPPSSLGNGVASFLLSCTGDSQSNQQKSYPFGVPNPSTVIHSSVVWDWRDPTQLQSDDTTWKASLNPVVNLVDYLTGPIGSLGLSFEVMIEPVLAMWTTAANVCDQQVVVINWSTFLLFASSGTDQSTYPAQNYMIVDDATGIRAGTVLWTGAENLTVVSVGPDPDFGYPRITFNRNITLSYPAGSWLQWQVTDGSATQNRYTMGGYTTYDNDPADAIALFLQTFDGWFSQDAQGHLIVYAGQYVAPTAEETIPPQAIVGYELKPFLEDELAVNTLMLAFVDPAHKWAMTDTDPWSDEPDILARGSERKQDMKLQWVHAHSQARRLAKRAMSRWVMPTGTLTLNLGGLAFLGKRYLNVSIPELATLANTVIEVRKIRIALQDMRVVIEYVIADQNIDSWNPAVEELNGPGVGLIPNNQPNPAPVIVSVTSVSGVAGAELLIVATSPLGAGLDWIMQVSPTGLNQWAQSTNRSMPVDGSSHVTLVTGQVPIGVLDVQVAYATGGSLSAFSATQTVTSSLAPSGVLSATATQAIPAGAFVHVSGSTMSLATAASSGPLSATGFVLKAVANGAVGSVYVSGLNSAIAASASATPVWLSPTTAGGYVTAAPTSPNMVQTLGSAIQGQGVAFTPGVPA